MPFYDFALKVRTHLYELHRLGEKNPTETIKDVCAKILQEGQDTWKRPLQGREEFRTLKEFEHWIFERALACNIETLLEVRYEENQSRPEGRRGRTRQVATERARPVHGEPRREEQGRSRFFRCGENYRLVNCQSFRNDSVEDRRRLMEEKPLCVSCLGYKHGNRDCRFRRQCQIDHCTEHHHELLHEKSRTAKRHTHNNTEGGLGGLLATTLVRTENAESEEVILNVLLNGVSDITHLGLKGVSEKVAVTTAGGGRMIVSKRVRVVVTSPEGERIALQSWTVPKVCDPQPRMDWNREKFKWKHLADLPLKATGGRINLLLESDYVDAIKAREVRIGKEFEPVAAKTRFGCLVVGRSGETTPKWCLVTTEE